MRGKLSSTVPVHSPRHWPYAAYYSALGRWRERRADDLRASVLVAGSPRSGTTWLGTMVADLTGWPLLVEPTNVNGVAEMRDGHGWDGRPQRDPAEPDDDLADDLGRLLTGRYLGAGLVKRSWEIDRALWTRQPVVSKVIDANLLLPWIAGHLPWLRTIHVVRHPLEVVASQEARTGSIWSQQPTLPMPYRRFMEQHPEYASPVELDTVAERLVTAWAIEHAWLRDRRADLERVLFLRYEDLRSDLGPQVERITTALGLPPVAEGALARLARPSRSVNRAQSTLSSTSESGWRARYDRSQRAALRAILARFDHPFYGPETMADAD